MTVRTAFLWLIFIIGTQFELSIVMQLDNSILLHIANSNFFMFSNAMESTVSKLDQVDFGLLILGLIISIISFNEMVKGKHISMLALVSFFHFGSFALDLFSNRQYRLADEMLTSSGIEYSGVKSRVYLYKYYKQKGDDRGIQLVLDKGLTYMNNDDLFVLLKNRKNHNNDLFVLKK